MRRRRWERLRRIFKAPVPKRLGAAEAAQTAHPGGTQSETQGDSSPSGSVDAPQGMATVAVVRRPSQAHQVSHTLACGQTVAGRFRILRFIGSGGMGEVFEAWDSELRERVALKTIRHEIASFPSVIDRFKQEVRQARGISHVNVCRVYEVFHHVQDSVEQMVAGLAAAHEHIVVHRDFKSSNVMLVDSPAGKTRAVVTDFGLALKVPTGHHIDPEESKQGTPCYMAPEQ